MMSRLASRFGRIAALTCLAVCFVLLAGCSGGGSDEVVAPQPPQYQITMVCTNGLVLLPDVTGKIAVSVGQTVAIGYTVIDAETQGGQGRLPYVEVYDLAGDLLPPTGKETWTFEDEMYYDIKLILDTETLATQRVLAVVPFHERENQYLSVEQFNQEQQRADNGFLLLEPSVTIFIDVMLRDVYGSSSGGGMVKADTYRVLDLNNHTVSTGFSWLVKQGFYQLQAHTEAGWITQWAYCTPGRG